jgi:hypothetical protein
VKFGLFPDMSEAEYRASKAVSCSALKRFDRAPALARWPQPETESMRAGRRIHAGVLEAWQFDGRYVRTDLDRRGTKAWQEEESAAAADGRILLKASEYDAIALIRDAVHAHPTARELLAPGLMTETAVFWRDTLTGAACRARMDGIRRDMRLIVDVKTTGDASAWKFARTAAEMKLHWQAAWYLEGLGMAPGGFQPEAMLFIAIERDAPHLIAVYELPPPAIMAGRDQVRRALDGYLACEAAGEWPGYPPQITPLHLPDWAMRTDEEETTA